MKTSKEYVEGIGKLKDNVHMGGKKIKRLEDPSIRKGINVIAATFDLALEKKYEDLFTARSHLSGEKIHRLAHIHQSPQDMMKKVQMTRLLCREVGGCVQRCMGADEMNALSNVSYQMDKDLGTHYHERYLKYLKHFQENDLILNTCMTDVKGDRRLRPHQQADPDLYLRIVKKNSDGIIVRGAKAHTGNSAYADEHFVLPTRGMSEKDKDYAVAFAVPADTEGVTLINHTAAPLTEKKMENPWSSRFNVTHSVTVFDDVFVPWERVFLCGEWQYAGELTRQFATYHRQSYCGCKPATTDVLIGAAALVAEFNGTDRAAHIRSKIADLITVAEMVYSCGIASAVNGKKMNSGTYFPDVTACNAGKYYAGTTIHHEYEIVQDIAGGLCATIPGEEEYFNPVTGKYMRKYLMGPADKDVEERIKCFYFIEDLTVSRTAGFWAAAAVHGGGSPDMEKKAILADYDLTEHMRIAKKLAGIIK